MPERIVLDHVAHAAERHDDLLPRYAGELGGQYLGSGAGTGFAPMQLRFANGAKVELLQPNRADLNPFLRRYLDRRGPGLHHATFKVPDIRATIASLEAGGYVIVDVDLSEPGWQEAFVHPKSAHGFLVQLAQAAGDMPASRAPAGFPEPAGPAASIVRLVLAVASLDAALVLYREHLAGDVVASGDDAGAWADLDHAGGQLVRLWQPDDPAVLDGAPGRADHLVVGVASPDAVSGAVPVGDGRWEVPAGANHGARLVLAEELDRR